MVPLPSPIHPMLVKRSIIAFGHEHLTMNSEQPEAETAFFPILVRSLQMHFVHYLKYSTAQPIQ
jgi:hypothetical protein